MLRRIIATAVAAVTMVAVLGAGSPADASAAGSFAASINAERAAAGRPALAFRSDLAAVARQHSRVMAGVDDLHHNPKLNDQVPNWQVVGENVGRGGDVASLHRAFMDSPSHRANILDRDFTEMGIGTVVDANGILWVTEVFRRPFARAVKAPEPTRKPRTAKRTPRPTPKATPRPTARPAKPVVRRPPAPKAAQPPSPPTARSGAKSRAAVRAKARAALVQRRVAEQGNRPRPLTSGALDQAFRYLDLMASLSR